MWATPRQICWQWNKAGEFYFAEEEPDMFVCQCSACQQHAGQELDNPFAFLKNELNKHCVYCQCRDCVCELRRQNRQYELAPRFYNWDHECFHSKCQVCRGAGAAIFKQSQTFSGGENKM